MEFAETLKALAKPVTDAASGAADSAEAAYLNSTLLNEVVDEFRTICETSYANLYTPAMGVCFSLLMIEFATDWTLYDGHVRLSKFLNTILKGCFFFFLISWWDLVINTVEDSFKMIAMVASGAGADGSLVEPSDILNQGFRICKDLFKELTTAIGKAIDGGKQAVTGGTWWDKGKDLWNAAKTGAAIKIAGGDFWTGAKGYYAAKALKGAATAVNPMSLLCMLIAIFMIIFAHLWIALELFLCYIEYYIFTGLATIFLPFGVFRQTKFIFDRTVQGLLNFGIKIMGAVFLISIAQHSIHMMDDSIVIEAGQEFSYYLKVSLLYLCIAFLVWKLPEKFAGLMSGHGPSISGSEAVGGAMVAAGLATGAVSTVGATAHTISMATRADIRDPSKGSTYNPLKIGGNLVELTATRLGSSITHPWTIGAANAERDVSQWDAFVKGEYENLKRDF